MENQPKGGFDSDEVSKEIAFGTNDVSFNGVVNYKEDSVETKELMQKIADGYTEKLIELSKKVNDLDNKEYTDSVKEEVKSLNKEWDKLYALISRLNNHVYGTETDASLN